MHVQLTMELFFPHFLGFVEMEPPGPSSGSVQRGTVLPLLKISAQNLQTIFVIRCAAAHVCVPHQHNI